jgi:hypothetical protein
MKDQEDRLILIERKDLRSVLVVITGFIALLCWWIGISGYMNVGGFSSGVSGFLTFLVVPILATAATYRVGRRYIRRMSLGRHRFSK